jgi:LysR family transcriptional regulator for bpeEF and oprC
LDKLRAIEYFLRAAEAGSFGRAARALDVSTPALTQLVSALERSLGVILLHRSPSGVVLTADGERYYGVALGACAELADIEDRLGPRGTRLRGTLSLGIRSGMAHALVLPHLWRFLQQHPDVDLVLKAVETLDETTSQQVDVTLTTGWPPTKDFAVRVLAQTRNLVCAAPAYWARRGEPTDPDELLQHDCLVMRSSGGTLMDQWVFEREGERRTVNVRPRIVSYHSAWVHAAACGGAGVIRTVESSIRPELASGALKAVLADWQGLEPPLQFAIYRPKQRQSRLVRAFLDFMVDAFAALDEAPRHDPAPPRTPRPDWFGRAQGRQSTFAARHKPPARKRGSA